MSFLNTIIPAQKTGFSPTSQFADSPQRPKLSINGFSPHFPVTLGIDKRTPGIDPMGMALQSVPTAWKGCFDRDERSGITKQGKTSISGVINPFVDTFHSKVLNEKYQQRGRFMSQNPGMDIKVKLTC